MTSEVTIVMYDKLPEDAKTIRRTVFVEEQGFHLEFDGDDGRSVHLVLYVDGKPGGTCRVFWSDERGCYIIGRVALMRECRGKGLGLKIMAEAENVVRSKGGNRIMLDSQVRVAPFYEAAGFRRTDETLIIEGVPHVWMEKDLKPQ